RLGWRLQCLPHMAHHARNQRPQLSGPQAQCGGGSVPQINQREPGGMMCLSAARCVDGSQTTSRTLSRLIAWSRSGAVQSDGSTTSPGIALGCGGTLPDTDAMRSSSLTSCAEGLLTLRRAWM